MMCRLTQPSSGWTASSSRVRSTSIALCAAVTVPNGIRSGLSPLTVEWMPSAAPLHDRRSSHIKIS